MAGGRLMRLALGAAVLVAAASHAAAAEPALAADLSRLRAALQRAGFKVEFRHPSIKTAYGLFNAKTRTLSISPLAFELGIGRQVFVHEAVHAAQSCPSGVLSPIGWKHSLAVVVEREISGILYNAYHHKNKALEREAFMAQGQPQGAELVIQALQQRCKR